MERMVKTIKVQQVIDMLDLEVVTGNSLEKEVKGGYVGDLLSNVMAKAEAGNIWVTIQGHQNVIAIALLIDVSAVIVAENFDIDEKAVERAEEKGVNLLRSSLSAYEIVGRLYENGITT